MKTMLLLVSSLSFSAQASDSEIAFDQIKNLGAGNYWVSNVRLENESGSYRIRFSQINKNRICSALGFSRAGGARIEFSESESVVSINRHLEMGRLNDSETRYIHNLNCLR